MSEPKQPPEKPTPPTMLDIVLKYDREQVIANVMRDHLTLTREEAEKMIEEAGG
jgi:hypothetical protein